MLNWYLQTGKNSDVVMHSKISLARNLSQFNFYIKEEQEFLKLENLLQEKIIQIGYGLKLVKLRDLNEIEIQCLLEKGLINQKMFQNPMLSSLLINDEENISILINPENHVQVQVLGSGEDIDAISNLCIEIDEKLQEVLDFSKCPQYGYLTVSPTDVGTGMKVSEILHLPALTKTKIIQKLITFVRQCGIEILKVQSPDIYKITNERTLGITEKDIVNNLKAMTEKIIEQERAARKLLAENQIELEDTILRSFGIFTNCKRISQKEAEELLSNLKLGTDLGIVKELTDAKIRKLYLYIKPAILSKYFGQEFDENIKRAEVIKQITND